MILWIIIIILSASTGLFCAFLFRDRARGLAGVFLAGAIPWFSVLTWLFYEAYLTPYQDGGASMWPIAKLIMGTVAAISGVFAYLFSKRFFMGRQ